ncbi:hypothetical protein TNCV_96771 [Trichonephila clavipes]|nr:hypothetical protein TNCV_96771 [Trichonephila clavipes]
MGYHWTITPETSTASTYRLNIDTTSTTGIKLYATNDSAPPFTTVKLWAAEFKRGRKRLRGDERSGRPSTATTDENIIKVQQMGLDSFKLNEIKLTPPN